MKAFVLTLFLMLLGSCEGVEYSLKTTYDASAGSCTNDEMQLIWGGVRRNMRERDLCTMSYKCRTKLCTGYPLNQCYLEHSECRCTRALEEQDDRQLQLSYCDAEKASIEARHSSTTTLNQLSSSCKSYVATRKYECFTVHDQQNLSSNQIIKFMLWNADTDTIVDYNMVDEDKFCENTFTFSIEAVAGVQVSSVKFELYGPNLYKYNHTEGTAPFTMFANKNNNQMNGAAYAAGDYDLMVTPDNDPSRARTLRFYILPATDTYCVNYVPPPAPTCNNATLLGQCRRSNNLCPTMYPNMGASECSVTFGRVCYCGSQPCGCWQ